MDTATGSGMTFTTLRAAKAALQTAEQTFRSVSQSKDHNALDEQCRKAAEQVMRVLRAAHASGLSLSSDLVCV